MALPGNLSPINGAVETTFKRRRKPVGKSLRLDETYKEENTIDFLLTKRRNKYAAHKFLLKAVRNNGFPGVINMDKS
jgi:putative transposase